MFQSNMLILFLILPLVSTAVLYPFGIIGLDQDISVSSNPSAVALDVPIIYYGESHSELYISSDGVVSFGTPIDALSVKDLDTERTTAIAAFYAPAVDGKVYYRAVSGKSEILEDLTDKIRKNFRQTETYQFKALSAIIITWNNMKGSDSDETNNFQLIIITDGMSSYATLLYDKLEWASSESHTAQAGFYHLDGRHETMVNSGTDSIKELARLSNMQTEGAHMYRISGNSIEDPHAAETTEDDYSYRDYEHEYDPEDETHEQEPPMIPETKSPVSKNNVNNLPSGRHEQDISLHDISDNSEQFANRNKLNEAPKSASPDTEYQGSFRREFESEGEPISPDALPGDSDDRIVEEKENGRFYPEQEQLNVQVETSQDDRYRIASESDSEGREEVTLDSSSISCAETSENEQPCHTNAVCVDYSPGHCCECLSGYYGNGKECLKEGEPQRISGSFEGVLNGEELPSSELHTYITTAEGRTYTALSEIPPHLGRSLLLLSPIGGVMGWLFAKVDSPYSYNGFQLTGGIFNRTVNVHIGDRSVATIKQYFSGRDVYHYFRAQVFITGTLPHLSEDAVVSYSDHEDEFRRERSGLVRAYSTYDVTVRQKGKEEVMILTVDQQIHYTECPHKTFDKDNVLLIKSTRFHVLYDSEERIVRYASANVAVTGRSREIPETSQDPKHRVGNEEHKAPQYKQEPERSGEAETEVADQSQEDNHRPIAEERSEAETLNNCAEGRHYCTSPNMFCTPVEQSYRCECFSGFQPELDASALLGWKCVDMNECERGDHTCNRNADCINNDGGFDCQCKQGFQGDGRTCQGVGGDDKTSGEESTVSSSTECRTHQDCHQWGECHFESDRAWGYCKCRGWYVGDGVSHCGPPEEGSKSELEPKREEVEKTEQLCGGYKCSFDADCVLSSRGVNECVCRKGFHGNGVHCSKLSTKVSQYDVLPVSGLRCRSHAECGEHGNCVYITEIGYYRCVCVPPYQGDGANCQKAEGAVEDQQCDQLKNCDLNAECFRDSYTQKFYCRCLDGYEGDGYSCNQITERVPSLPAETTEPLRSCREATDCDQNAHCVERESTHEYFCECLPGFKGDGVSDCSVADECNPADTQGCHENAECVFGQHEAAYLCKCIQGFTGDGRMCDHISREPTCAEVVGMCHENADCLINRDHNRYECVCRSGFTGDGQSRCEPTVESRCSSCSEHASCVKTQQDSWLCQCKAGYQGNGQVCSRVYTCLEDRSLCDKNAECVPGEFGNYVCNCRFGYHGDGRSCRTDSDDHEEPLLIGRGMAIIKRGTNPDVPGKQLVVIPYQIVVGIDYDCQEERIVWSDISGHVLRSSKLDGTDEKKILEFVLKSPEGIAIDWSSRNVYYADSAKDEIGIASLDGTFQKALLTEGLFNPRALAIDMNGRQLYYSDWHRERPVIGRMDLDGSHHELFITSGLNLPNGLAIIHERRELCWVDAGNQRLSCIGLDGSNRRVVYAPLEYPFGLTVHNDQKFYWTDWKDNLIHTASIYGDSHRAFQSSIGGSAKIYGINAIHTQCRGAPTGCALNNGGCAYMCLPGRTQITCACPDNIKNLEGC